ncbi:hypothetical protein Rhow_005012 [Rhodococcus wratislaviensis]|uniref:Uncharacterized protein n=1 Tax=Rhodococcus wratislaviensis TaxID=44752 RepID=A0A402CCR8_RHOWR|nr:hypothetical protein Rhow_005012 [Rhodococcus wratislaviensis]
MHGFGIPPGRSAQTLNISDCARAEHNPATSHKWPAADRHLPVQQLDGAGSPRNRASR